MATSERNMWEEQCDTLLCEAIAALGRYNGSLDARRWRAVATRGPLTVSRHVDDENNTATSTRLAGTGYLHGRLDDITRGLYCDTDDDLVGNEAVLTGEPVFDGAVLQALETRGPETPFRFAGVKWVAMQCGGLPRDLLTFERMGMTLDSDNTEVGYHVVYAIPDHADWPTATQLCATRRNNIYRQRQAPEELTRLEPFALCYLYRKVSEDRVLCFILGEYWGHATGTIQSEAEHVLTQRVLMVSNAVVSCEAKILTRMLDHCKDTPMHKSKTCLRCRATRRTATEPLGICGICRKSVCRTCRCLKSTSRLDPATKVAATQVFCVRCLIRANIPTAPSSESRRGLRNTEHNLIDRRQRRDLQHHQHYQHHERRRVATEQHTRNHITNREARGRVHTNHFIPPHAYNYDGLLHNQASARSWTPLPRSASDEGWASGGGTQMIAPRRGAESLRGHDDLYLRGTLLSTASGEAERRYQRHLERDKRLRVEDLHDALTSESSQQPLMISSPSVVSLRGLGERREPAQPSIILSPTTMRSQSTVQAFYRDLYTET